MSPQQANEIRLESYPTTVNVSQIMQVAKAMQMEGLLPKNLQAARMIWQGQSGG